MRKLSKNLAKLKLATSIYKTDNEFLKIKFDHCQAKLTSQIESNSSLYSGRKLAHATLNPENQDESETPGKRQFLAHAKCIEIEDLVDPQVEITYLLDTLLKVG